MSKMKFILVYKMVSLHVFLFSVQFVYIVLASHNVEDLSQHKNFHLLPSRCGLTKFGRLPTCVRPRVKDGFCKAQPGQFPWMAQIYTEDTDLDLMHQCGGSIINDRYILTAAHCVKKRRRYVALVGEIHGTKHCKRGNGKCYDVESVLHEKFNYQNGDNDIALLRLSHRIDLSSDTVSPICLPLNFYPDLHGLFTLAGWGYINKGQLATTLKYDNIPYKSHQNSIIYAGDYRASCNGDSGGPLMKGYQQPQGDTRNYILGIVSMGQPCTQVHISFIPGKYTRVTSYLSWILDNIRD